MLTYNLSQPETDAMTPEQVRSIQTRADAKVRYAALHLDELRRDASDRGGDFSRAHQESFCFHLLGVKEALLHEINAYYGCGLPADKMTLGQIKTALEKKKRASPEVEEIYTLEQDNNSWLAQAKLMRDGLTHVSGARILHYIGGTNHGQASLHQPKTGALIPGDFLDVFQGWLSDMGNLLAGLRKSAMQANSIKPP